MVNDQLDKFMKGSYRDNVVEGGGCCILKYKEGVESVFYV